MHYVHKIKLGDFINLEKKRTIKIHAYESSC